MFFNSVVRLAVIAATVAFAAGCGGNVCDRPPPCPGDPSPSETDRAQCRATLEANASSACYSEAYAYSECAVYTAAVCGGDGKYSYSLTATKAASICVNQKANVTSCCVKNPSATACKGF